LKHGAYAKTFVLPGENLADFRELKAGLEAELEPQGLLQREQVANIATWIWRRRRLNELAGFRTRILDASETMPDNDAIRRARDPISKLTERVAIIRARRSAIRLSHMILKWAVAVVENAESHIDLTNVATELGRAFGIDADMLGEKGTPSQLTDRKKAFLTFIQTRLRGKLASLAANERESEQAFVRDVANQIFPCDPMAEIELEARVSAELDKCIRRFIQLKAAQQALQSLEIGNATPINGNLRLPHPVGDD
jgi:hypothetical protein